MRDALVRDIVHNLIDSLGEPRKPIDIEPFKVLHSKQQYAQMLGLVRSSFNLKLQITLGLVNSGGSPRAPAWILTTGEVPPIYSSEFQNFKATVFIRRSFIAVAPCETLVLAMAHELSHVVLHSLQHSLRFQEEAVDLTAMLLGYRHLFQPHTSFRHSVSLQRAEEIVQKLGLKSKNAVGAVMHYLRITAPTQSCGYLSPEEINYAVKLMRV